MNVETEHIDFRFSMVLFILGCTFLAALIGPRSIPGNVPQEFTSSDIETYYLMARESPDAAIDPFAYRVGAPLLMSIMPFDVEMNSFIITYISTVLTGYLFYLLLISININVIVSITVTTLLMFSYPITFYLGAFGRIDAPANALMVGSVYFLARRNYALSTITMCVGLVFRETALMLLPIIVFDYIVTSKHKKHIVHLVCITLLIVASAFMTMAIIRLLVTPSGSILNEGGIVDLVERTIGSKNNVIVSFVHAAWLAYGFLWFVIIPGLLTRFDKWNLYGIYFIISSSLLLLVASDWHRMLSLSFVGVFILVARAISLNPHKYVVFSVVLIAMINSWLTFIRFSELKQSVQVLYVIAVIGILIFGIMISITLAKHTSEKPEPANHGLK